MAFPGSEPIQFDMEKLFLLAVSKENFSFRGQIYNLKFKHFILDFLWALFNVEFPYFLFSG